MIGISISKLIPKAVLITVGLAPLDREDRTIGQHQGKMNL